MKVFLAGATGVLGRRLIPVLVGEGHAVTASTRSPSNLNTLRELGAEPVLCDALNRDAVLRVVTLARPDVVIHELTALTGVRSYRNFDKAFAETNRLRTEGLDNLIAGAQEAGASRFIAQSYAGWPTACGEQRVTTESDRLDSEPVQSMIQSLAAIRHIEETVPILVNLVGIVLRYGPLYGPGTDYSTTGTWTKLVKRMGFPIIGNGQGVWSFIHVDDAVSATCNAVTRGQAGIYNIVDDDPAEVSQWLPVFAKSVGARHPLSVPRWMGRLIAGDSVVRQMTGICGSSNEKAKRALHWKPEFSSWRDGFRICEDCKFEESSE